MTAINQLTLMEAQPIKNMLDRKVQLHGVSHGLGEAGYDIRIKQAISFYPSALGFGRVARLEDGYIPYYEDGNFVLASALEEFTMPENLLGIVHDKSTWARKGLSVLNTVIEPGWRGFLTLELVYHGARPLHIEAGSGIAQVIFHAVSDPVCYDGKYQNQPNRPVEPRLTV